MRDSLERRIRELEDESRAGQKMLADLDAQRLEVQQTLLRISGALQILGELLDAESDPASGTENPDPVAAFNQPAA